MIRRPSSTLPGSLARVGCCQGLRFEIRRV
nr:MAG TPA: hypothetical protein [Caudoviricetes sp.]